MSAAPLTLGETPVLSARTDARRIMLLLASAMLDMAKPDALAGLSTRASDDIDTEQVAIREAYLRRVVDVIGPRLDELAAALDARGPGFADTLSDTAGDHVIRVAGLDLGDA